MNLMKWFRKNNMKIMAVVIIVILFGFIGGEFFRQLGRKKSGGNIAIAYFGDDTEITTNDRNLARQQLEVLEALRISTILRNVGLAGFSQQDLTAVLLSELLFSDRRVSPALSKRISQLVTSSGYRLSNKQIYDIYGGSAGKDIVWLLLKNEAKQAGITMSNEPAGTLLGKAIPQLFQGATYSQLIGTLMSRYGMPEEEILATFSELLAVLEYARMICSTEDVTSAQIRHNVSLEQETINVELVRFDATIFAETQDEPTQQEMDEHFNKYKKFFAGNISEENPYGFGYKLDDRVRLEYIAINLDDVSGIITAPTQEEAEEYYQRYREQLFVEQVPSDPNDPNSPTIDRTKSYAEVASSILEQLRRNKINSRAERIMQQVRTLTEADIDQAATEADNLSAEQFGQLAGDYEAAAEQLSKEHEIKVYTGKTGLLTAIDIGFDKRLSSLFMESYGFHPVYNPTIVRLVNIVFAVDELGISELGPFDIPKPRMHENIGPLKDALEKVRVVARVVEVKKAAVPKDINEIFSKSMLKIEQTEEQADEDVYSVKEHIVEGLKRLAAMKTAKSKADEFIALAEKDSWDGAISKFNKRYAEQHKQDQNEPNAFDLQTVSNMPRLSDMTMETLEVQNRGNPLVRIVLNLKKAERQLGDEIYSLVPADANSLDAVPLVLESKPNMSYYCLKSLSINRVDQERFESIKAWQAYKEDVVQSQSLTAVHFNPENILKRMKFRWAEPVETPADANVSEGSKEAL